jgi:hypothetical protein
MPTKMDKLRFDGKVAIITGAGGGKFKINYCPHLITHSAQHNN